ncbi:MAG: ribosylnicotinamide kinase [Caeruleum heppii]|nr:MAG: ribosylnicotinamide kinase [Caeruleum heppii]
MDLLSRITSLPILSTILSSSPSPQASSPKVHLIGISGGPNSRKFTLAALLAGVLSAKGMVHVDDFRTDAKKRNREPGSINIPRMIEALDNIRQTGLVPEQTSVEPDEKKPWLSWRDVAAKATMVVGEQELGETERMIRMAHVRIEKPVVIVHGSGLFDDPRIRELLEVLLFTRARYSLAKERELAKSGHRDVRSEGKKVVQHFEKVVWPAYVEECGDLYLDGDVEGEVSEEVAEGLRIDVPPEMDWKMSEMLMWATKAVLLELGVEGHAFELCDCHSRRIGRLRDWIRDLP